MAGDLRERSCRLRCSLLLKARLQNWHLYFFSGAEVFLAGELLAEGAEGAISGHGAQRTGRPQLSSQFGSNGEKECGIVESASSHRI